MSNSDQDIYWMKKALAIAEKGFQSGNIPVGAVLVKDNQLIAQAHNLKENVLQHAEKIVVESVIAEGEKYLYDYTLYVTVEPCSMCAGIIVWSRVGRLVIGAQDTKAGACGSVYNIPEDRQLNHNPEVVRGVLKEECSHLMSEFFREKRKERRDAGAVERGGLENH